jgi:putative ABC transport system substrate-binding protein
LQQLGWTDGRNVQIETRWTAGNAEDARKYAAELVALAPNVILAAGSSSTGPLMQISGTVPIVFVHVPDPVGAGYVNSLARPGGNATGFSFSEYSIGGKWLDLLKQIAPGVTRVAVLRDPLNFRRARPVCCGPVRGVIVRGGGEPDRRPQRGRD